MEGALSSFPTLFFLPPHLHAALPFFSSAVCLPWALGPPPGAPTGRVSVSAHRRDAVSSCLFQILPPQPLTSCLSLTSCPLCPSVCFAISDFIDLPGVLLWFISCSLFLLSLSPPLCLLPPPHSSVLLVGSPLPPLHVPLYYWDASPGPY